MQLAFRLRRGLTEAGRVTALVALLAHVLAGGLLHAERVADRGQRLTADAAATPHGVICQACVLAHAPAAPGGSVSLATRPAAAVLVLPTFALAPARSAPRTTARSRAPPQPSI